MRALTSRVHGRFLVAATAGLLVAAAGCSKSDREGSTPPAPTYSVSGAVTVGGLPLAGVTVRIQGTSRQAVTDASGGYTIAFLANGTYTLQASLGGYTLSPATLTVTVSGANVTGRNFTATVIPPPPPSWAIAGKVTGDGPEGVTLRLVGPEPATTTVIATSGAGGTYQFTNVVAGVYRLTPSRPGGWTFSPANALVTMAGTSLTGPDFVSVAPTHGLSGRITGAVTAGVTVTLSGDADAVSLTDPSGVYTFAGLPPGSYGVTPSYPGYAFTPASRDVAVGNSDVAGQDFVSVATHSIAGRISGDVLENVRISVSGPVTKGDITDASGYFEVADLPDGVYTVRAAIDGYVFAPAELTVTLAGAHVTNANFAATAAPPATYVVSGAVTGAVLRGVTVTLQGDPTEVTTTDVTGAFRFAAVPAGSYLIIPTHDDYTFDPAGRFVVVGGNLAGQAFTATVKPTARTISGTITGDATAGVTVTLAGPSPATTTRTVITDAQGDFAFRGLADGLYLATPSRPGFTFKPADCLVRVAGPSVTSIQFTSAAAPHAISGQLTGAVVAGVPVNLTGDATALTTTAVDGSYSFPDLANGSYTVTPALLGYYFGPVWRSVTVSGVDVTGVDFVAAQTHGISGHVSGDLVSGVTVKLTGATSDQTTTDGTGLFQFSELPDGGYILTASAGGYALAPAAVTVTLAGANVTTADFTSTLIPTFTVSGTITGSAQSGALVELTGGASRTTFTAVDGTYSFSGLANGSYQVIPALPGHAFTPGSRAFRVDDADVTGQDFDSVLAP